MRNPEKLKLYRSLKLSLRTQLTITARKSYSSFKLAKQSRKSKKKRRNIGLTEPKDGLVLHSSL